MKRISFLLQASILLLGLHLAGCNQSGGNDGADGQDKIVVGVSMLSMQNEFIVNVADEIEKKADELGVELITVDAERSSLKQIEQVESFIAQDVDVIIMNPCEVEASSPAVTKALAAKVPIINVNSATSS